MVSVHPKIYLYYNYSITIIIVNKMLKFLYKKYKEIVQFFSIKIINKMIKFSSKNLIRIHKKSFKKD